jgi:hypothetical protein
MSVMMGMRTTVDPERFADVVASNTDRIVAIADRARQHGAIHHRFYASEARDEVLVVDQWPTPSRSTSSSPTVQTSAS